MSENGSNDVRHTDNVVVRKAERGWVVGEENVSDLTSAMVLADLFAADQAVSQDTGLLEAVDADGAPRRPLARRPAAQQHRAAAGRGRDQRAPRGRAAGSHRCPA